MLSPIRSITHVTTWMTFKIPFNSSGPFPIAITTQRTPLCNKQIKLIEIAQHIDHVWQHMPHPISIVHHLSDERLHHWSSKSRLVTPWITVLMSFWCALLLNGMIHWSCLFCSASVHINFPMFLWILHLHFSLWHNYIPLFYYDTIYPAILHLMGTIPFFQVFAFSKKKPQTYYFGTFGTFLFIFGLLGMWHLRELLNQKTDSS